MTDRENVIKGLWCCNHAGNCSVCPFDIKGGTDRDQKGSTCLQNLIAAAYDAMKAQEPRVVKMSELTAGEPMLVWLEDIDKEETVAGMIFDYVPGRLGFKLTDLASRDRIYPRIEDYLTRWRCWTSRPDKATREATPWQGSSNL